jgi:hypothetical protein
VRAVVGELDEARRLEERLAFEASVERVGPRDLEAQRGTAVPVALLELDAARDPGVDAPVAETPREPPSPEERLDLTVVPAEHVVLLDPDARLSPHGVDLVAPEVLHVVVVVAGARADDGVGLPSQLLGQHVRDAPPREASRPPDPPVVREQRGVVRGAHPGLEDLLGVERAVEPPRPLALPGELRHVSLPDGLLGADDLLLAGVVVRPPPPVIWTDAALVAHRIRALELAHLLHRALDVEARTCGQRRSGPEERERCRHHSRQGASPQGVAASEKVRLPVLSSAHAF